MMTEDLAAFFRDAEHGSAMIYTPPGYPPGGGAAVSFTGIFDRDAVEVSLATGANVRGYRSIAVAAVADLPGLEVGAHVQAGGLTFRVAHFELDQTGTIYTLILSLVQ